MPDFQLPASAIFLCAFSGHWYPLCLCFEASWKCLGISSSRSITHENWWKNRDIPLPGGHPACGQAHGYSVLLWVFPRESPSCPSWWQRWQSIFFPVSVPSLSCFLSSLLAFPEITSQVNHLHPNPGLVSFWGKANRTLYQVFSLAYSLNTRWEQVAKTG